MLKAESLSDGRILVSGDYREKNSNFLAGYFLCFADGNGELEDDIKNIKVNFGRLARSCQIDKDKELKDYDISYVFLNNVLVMENGNIVFIENESYTKSVTTGYVENQCYTRGFFCLWVF